MTSAGATPAPPAVAPGFLRSISGFQLRTNSRPNPVMKTNILFRTTLVASASVLFITNVLAQVPTTQPAPDEGGGIGWIFVVGVILVIGIGAVIAWRVKQNESASPVPVSRRNSLVYEWKPKEIRSETDPTGADVPRETKPAAKSTSAANASLHGIDLEDVKVKMEKIRFERLPINRLDSLKSPRPFNALPEGEEEMLLNAIDESDVEYVEDEDRRDAALDVLAGFRTRNAVEAISQMAIYDISATLRSKAVGILADIDHESVFESVILSCADPTREVRAASARALFKLSFNRRDAWLRLAECGDQYRLSQAAKAAIEADFVGRSLERLVHNDVSYAGEALALLTLLIRAGETEELLDYMLLGEKKEIKLALLKVFGVVGDEGVIEKVRELVESESLSYDIIEEARMLVEGYRPVKVSSER